MPKVYSLDLRKKVFSAWQAGEGSQRELAKRFNVSLSFIRDLSRRYRETGTIAPKPQGGDIAFPRLIRFTQEDTIEDALFESRVAERIT
jgi:transposase